MHVLIHVDFYIHAQIHTEIKCMQLYVSELATRCVVYCSHPADDCGPTLSWNCQAAEEEFGSTGGGGKVQC